MLFGFVLTKLSRPGINWGSLKPYWTFCLRLGWPGIDRGIYRGSMELLPQARLTKPMSQSTKGVLAVTRFSKSALNPIFWPLFTLTDLYTPYTTSIQWNLLIEKVEKCLTFKFKRTLVFVKTNFTCLLHSNKSRSITTHLCAFPKCMQALFTWFYENNYKTLF